MQTTAVYPGSFDPITFGHLDIIRRAHVLFPQLIVAVVNNPRKTALFSVQERIAMITDAVHDMPNIRVESFDGLLVNFLAMHKATIVIRGLRAISDFEYEFQLALTNRKLDSNIETLFLMPSEEYSYLNSSLVKEIARLGGNVSRFVPATVAGALKKLTR